MENIKTEINNNMILRIFKGVVISIALTLILLILFAGVLTYSNISETTIPVVIILISAVSIFIGSSISTIKIKKNGIVNGGIIGIIYILLIYLISSIVRVGFGINIYTIVMIILGILAGMIGGIVGVNLK